MREADAVHEIRSSPTKEIDSGRATKNEPCDYQPPERVKSKEAKGIDKKGQKRKGSNKQTQKQLAARPSPCWRDLAAEIVDQAEAKKKKKEDADPCR